VLNVLTVIGTRPEAIKMAPVIKELRRHSDAVNSRICVTAQHRRMLDQVLDLFALKPDYDLDIMQNDQTLGYVTARVLTDLPGVIADCRPDWLLVQGDTTTTMAAALVAYYHRVRVGHVEAGLRTGDRFSPYPEEVNRRLADVLSDLHFVPTERARQNLLGEGIRASSILLTGNTVVDALLEISSRPFDFRDTLLEQLDADDRRIILVTAHRRESFGPPMEELCGALRDIAARYASTVHVVYPVHPNPNVSGPVRRLLGGLPNVLLTEPLDYLSLVHLMKRSFVLLTDSGGLQEEAPSLGKPLLVLREATERPEAVEAGAARVVGMKRGSIIEWTERLLNDAQEYARMARVVNPYGDGRASQRIVAALLGDRQR
jgi:UDP-N-acetylglucosamine 2-epimerase (non-hydrolysing)